MTLKEPPFEARALGYAGLMPFFAAAMTLIIGPESWTGAAQGALISYGAIILSFMGGCRWGFAAAASGGASGWAPYAISVLPALYAWVVALAPFPWAGAALALGFAALYCVDRRDSLTGAAPVWWAALRLPLTIGAAGSLMVGALAS